MTRPLITRIWNVLNSKFVFAMLLIVAIVLVPSRSLSQFVDPCCAVITTGLNTISGLLRNLVAAPLKSIQQIQQQQAAFEQQTIWPQNAINQARGFAAQAQGQFRQMNQLYQIPVSSATLAVPQRLEQTLLSATPQNIGQVT